MKSKKNRNDFVLILVLPAVILIGFLVVRLQRQKDAFTVDVSVNGTTVATYRLDEEIDTWIDGYQGGQNHLVIQDGCARIEEYYQQSPSFSYPGRWDIHLKGCFVQR